MVVVGRGGVGRVWRAVVVLVVMRGSTVVRRVVRRGGVVLCIAVMRMVLRVVVRVVVRRGTLGVVARVVVRVVVRRGALGVVARVVVLGRALGAVARVVVRRGALRVPMREVVQAVVGTMPQAVMMMVAACVGAQRSVGTHRASARSVRRRATRGALVRISGRLNAMLVATGISGRSIAWISWRPMPGIVVAEILRHPATGISSIGSSG